MLPVWGHKLLSPPGTSSLVTPRVPMVLDHNECHAHCPFLLAGLSPCLGRVPRSRAGDRFRKGSQETHRREGGKQKRDGAEQEWGLGWSLGVA